MSNDTKSTPVKPLTVKSLTVKSGVRAGSLPRTARID